MLDRNNGAVLGHRGRMAQTSDGRAVAPNNDGALPTRSGRKVPCPAERPVIIPIDLDAACAAIQELQVRRKFWIGIVNKQSNALGALVRRMLGFRNDIDEKAREKLAKRAARLVARALEGEEQTDEDKAVADGLRADLGAFSEAMKAPEARRHDIELQMKRAVRKLPIAEWAAGVRGLGEIGLAVIIGEAGNLANYATERKLWRRLGLGMAPGHEDHAYSTWRKQGGLTAEDWTAAGYAPRRRAEIHSCVGEPLFRQQTVISGRYRLAYDRRRAHCEMTHPDWAKAHSHADGLRIMTKLLVADLWSAWRSGSGLAEKPCVHVAATNIEGESEFAMADRPEHGLAHSSTLLDEAAEAKLARAPGSTVALVEIEMGPA